MPAPRPPARLAAVEPAPVRSLEHSHSGNRPVAPSFERGPLACSLALPCVVFAGVIDLVSILGLFSNFIHMPLCSTMNKMVTIDVLDDQMRLALQAVAHNVLAEPRGIILLTLLHMHIFFMTLKWVVFLGYDASEVMDRSSQVPSGRAVAALPEVRAHRERRGRVRPTFCSHPPHSEDPANAAVLK